MDELFPTIHIDELLPSVNTDELYSTIYFDEHFPSVNMEEHYFTIYYDELSLQSTWISSTQLFTLTSPPISQNGRALLCFSHYQALLSVNLDELFPTIHIDELFLTIHIDELFPSVNIDELYSAFRIYEISHQSNLEELFFTIYYDELSQKSTWTSSTLLFTLTSSPISQHGRALLCFSH